MSQKANIMNSKQTELIKVYTAMLGAVHMSVREADDVILTSTGKPLMHEGKKFILPTAFGLDTFDPEDSIIFHPLREDVLMGKNTAAVTYQRWLLLAINLTISDMVTGLLGLAATTNGKASIDPDQLDFYKSIGQVDTTAAKNIAMYSINNNNSMEKLFYSVFLKKNGKFNGKPHASVGIVSFPFYEQVSDKGKIEGLRVADVAVAKRLMEYMFPNCEDNDKTELYNYGVNSECYTINALMMTVLKVTQRLNELTNVFGPSFIANGHWTQEQFENSIFEFYLPAGFNDFGELGAIARSVPIQRDSSLTAETVEEVKPVVKPVQPQAPIPAQPVQQPAPQPMIHPAYQQQPVPQAKTTANGSVSLAQVLGPEVAYQQQMQQPMMMQPQMPYGYMPPQQQMPYGYPQQMMAPPQPRNMHQLAMPPAMRPQMPQQPGYGYMPPPQQMQQPMMQVDPYGRPVDQYGRLLPAQPQQPQVFTDPQGRPVDQYGRYI